MGYLQAVQSNFQEAATLKPCYVNCKRIADSTPNNTCPAMYTSTPSIDRKEQPIKLLWIVLGMRNALFLAELIVGLWVHSLSLLAVAGHMMVDVFAIAVALVAAELTHRPSNKLNIDPVHLDAWAALMNSLLLLGIAVFVASEAIDQIQEPQVSAGLPILIMAVL